MSSEFDQRVDSTSLSFKYSKTDIVENFSNVPTEDPVNKIKQEPKDNFQNTQKNIQVGFKLLLPELKTEENDTSSAVELDVESKIEIEEPTDCKNFFETPLKVEIVRTNNRKKSRWKEPGNKLDSIIKSLLQCDYCDYTTKVKSNLRMHLRRIHLKTWRYKRDICNFQCRYCDYVGTNQEALLAHRITNHSMHKCRFCDYVTKRKEHLEAHENAIHLKKENYSCSDCSYTTLYKCSMWTHIRLMHKQLYFSCDRCDYKTKTQRYLKSHINAIHTKLELVYCAHCDYTATLKSRLATHLRKNHALTASFKCEKCNFASKEMSELVRHTKADHGNCRFECNNCDYVAKTKILLKSHILAKHLKQRPFQCKLCPYAGFTSSRLFLHTKAKHKEVCKKLIKDEFVFC